VTAVLKGYGVSMALPVGWEGRITRLTPSDPLTSRAHAAVPTVGIETTNPFLHATNMALPSENDSFGGGIVERMGPDNVLIALIEFSSECAGTKLFSKRGIPRALPTRAFDRRTLQRMIPGQSGHQSFCTENGRAFCLYVVAGAHARLGSRIHAINGVLRTLDISALGVAQ
jgi:hypothetical protein